MSLADHEWSNSFARKVRRFPNTQTPIHRKSHFRAHRLPTSLQAVEACGELVIPHLTKEAFAAVLACAPAAAAAAAATAAPPLALPAVLQQFPTFRGITALYVSAAAAEMIFGAVRAWCCSKVTIELQRSLRSRLLGTLLQQEALWFGRRGNRASELASRLSADCSAVSLMVSGNLHNILSSVFMATGGLVYLCFLNGSLAAVTVVMTAVLCHISLRCASPRSCHPSASHTPGRS